MSKLEDKINDQIIITDDDYLVIASDRYYFFCWLDNLVTLLFELVYPDSESEWEFNQDFPRHLCPWIHDEPNFGFYPLTIIK